MAERSKRRQSRGGWELTLVTLQKEWDDKDNTRLWLVMAPSVSREVIEVKSVTHGPPPPPSSQGEKCLEVCNDRLLWCWRKDKPAHGFASGRLEGSGGGSGASSSLSAAPDVTTVSIQTFHVVLTQWREEFVVISIDRVSEAPKDADDADPLSAPGR